MLGSRYNGMFQATDLDTIQKVFDQLCKERRLAQKDKEQRERLAAEVVRVFQGGVSDEAALWRTLSKRRSARRARGISGAYRKRVIA